MAFQGSYACELKGCFESEYSKGSGGMRAGPVTPATNHQPPPTLQLSDLSSPPHSCDSLDGELKHTDYLARGGGDFRRELLDRLVSDLGGGDGSIVIYSTYEKTQLLAMAKLHPDMAGDVEGIVARLVDFEQVIKSHVSHPEFRGRSSLKVTLPALVPEYSGRYAGMAVRDGQQASARFFSLAKGGLDPEEEKRMRQELLDYCEVMLNSPLSSKPLCMTRA